MEVAKLKMMRWALGVTRKDNMKNEYVRGTAKIAKLGGKLRGTRLRWYGRVKRREDYVGKRMVDLPIPQYLVKEKKANEKMDGFGLRSHGDGWSKGGRQS